MYKNNSYEKKDSICWQCCSPCGTTSAGRMTLNDMPLNKKLHSKPIRTRRKPISKPIPILSTESLVATWRRHGRTVPLIKPEQPIRHPVPPETFDPSKRRPTPMKQPVRGKPDFRQFLDQFLCLCRMWVRILLCRKILSKAVKEWKWRLLSSGLSSHCLRLQHAFPA